MKTVSLPVPLWKTFFDRNRSIDASSSFYKELREAFLARKMTEFQLDRLEESWSYSVKEGTIFFDTLHAGQLQAEFQIVGELSGGKFLWGDANPAVPAPLAKDARSFRTVAKERGYPIGEEDKFRAGERDAIAVLALCASTLKSQRWFAAWSDDTFKLMTLNNLPVEGNCDTARGAATDTEEPRMMTSDLFHPLIGELQPDESELIDIEDDFDCAYQAYEAENNQLALDRTAKIKRVLGEPFIEMEQSAWICLLEGAALLQLDRKSEAKAAFELARRCLAHPDPFIRYLGLSRAEEDDGAQLDSLCGAYILDPDRFIALTAPQEQVRIRALLAEVLVEEHARGTAKDAWNSALNIYRELEKHAYAMDKEARRHRVVANQWCDEDRKAYATRHKSWRRFCLTWLTPGRSPLLEFIL